ncbi:MAG: GNAT family N-acetyltransferase [Chloroflexi bacterium]|nr:GNAT family N-acetyltransferase [Chloroflexota bacterium]
MIGHIPSAESSIELRRLAPQWIGPLAEFFRTLRQKGDNIHFHPHPLTDEAASERAVSPGMDMYYVLLDRNDVIGYGMLRGWEEGYEVPSLGIAIHPAVRGQGLGRTFMHFLHSVARVRGAKKIRLKVYPENSPALRLYLSLGYRFEEKHDDQLVGFLDLTDE